MKSSVTRYTLPNGLRVIHDYDPSQAMTVVNLLYDVGSRDESRDLTGMAHLFEHLMFGGSVNIPDFDEQLTRAGGQSNAWTSTDFTCFYDIVPTQNIETALWLESDRMLSLSFADKALEVQRQVVIEEFKQVCLNRPYGDQDHLLRAMCYGNHPYGNPVIGKDFSHIERVTQHDVRRWFAAHYAPNNAVLSLAGSVPPDRLRSLVEKWFGPIEARPVAPRLYGDPAAPAGPLVTETSGDVPQTALTLAYPMDGYGTEGYFAADAISDLLANGRSSRLYQRLLLPGRYFSELDAAIIGSEHPGLLLVTAKLLDEAMESEALAAIRGELAMLAEEGPGERELGRCVNRLRSDRTFGLLGLLPRAQSNALAEMHGETPDESLHRYEALTPAVVADTARKILDPSRERLLAYRPA